MVPRIPEPHDGAGAAVQEELFSQAADEAEVPRRRHDGRAGGDDRGVGIRRQDSPSKCRRPRRTRWPRSSLALAFSSIARRGVGTCPSATRKADQLGLGEVLEAVKPLLENAAVPEGGAQRQRGNDRAVAARHRGGGAGLRHDAGGAPGRAQGAGPEGAGHRAAWRGADARLGPARHRAKADHDGAGAHRRRGELRGGER